MAHKSRIGVIVIDCQTRDLSEAVAFWSAALGREGRIDPDGQYAQFDGHAGYPKVLLQKVDHEPRVHLDIETDDREAEVGRLEALGAARVGDVKSWTVMQAPTGHRFCVVGTQGPDFPGEAAAWP
jgi:predicted enzyme related to lactoylglutathione lyase